MALPLLRVPLQADAVRETEYERADRGRQPNGFLRRCESARHERRSRDRAIAAKRLVRTPGVRALASSYRTLGVTIPTRRGRTENARSAFYYLLNFLTLGFWTVALGQIFYALIARRLPDRLAIPYAHAGSLRDAIAWQLATVIVTFPLFAFVHVSLERQLTAQPELYDSGVRKWLTYVALVIAASVVLGDGIWFLYSLISGGLTLRFVLDSVVLLVLGGGVFAFYLTTIDGPQKE